MKNLKKVLALVVVFTMVLSSVAFASYPDVDATADYAGAVELLSALSILKGDDTGNFNPDQNITRAEFAAVVCRALGLEGSANGAKGATDFTDVAADHWASGYINLASQQNIINGMGDGTFAPESDVTYTQAVKMLVVALGYEPMAEKKGGYPAGYLATANSIGLTEGVPSTASDVAALRSTVAMLTANAMELPTMEQHTYGTDALFGVNDGKNNTTFKSLLTAMDIYIATGVVESIDASTRLTAELKPTQDSDDGKFKMTYHKEDTDNDGTEEDVLDRIELQVNGSNIADYVNQKVNVYVEVKKSKNYVVAIVPSDEGTTTEIDAGLITVANVVDADNDNNFDEDLKAQGYVEYYETADSTKESKMYIDTNVSVVVNGVVKTNLYAELKALANEDATVKFIENTGDKYNDTVEITVYKHYTVKEVDAAKDRIVFNTVGGTVTFTDFLDDDSYEIKFKDAEGNDIEIADFAEDDVVAVVANDVAKVKPANDNKVITYYNLGESLVNGAVTSVESASKIYIDGTAYEVVGTQVGTEQGNVLGAEGAYYLTKSGKVFYYDGTLAKNYKVAYVLDAYYNSTGISANTLQFQLLTADQGIVIVDATSTFTAPGFNKVELKKDNDNNGTVDGKEIADKYEDTNTSTVKADRLVKYKLNSDNYLKSIETYAAADRTPLNNAEYDKDLVRLGTKDIVEGIKIFVIDGEKSYVTSMSALNEDNKYNGILADYDDDDDTYAVAVLDGADMSGVDKSQGIAVVASKADTLYEGEDATVMTVYSDNSEEAKTLYFVDGKSNKATGNDKEGTPVNVANMPAYTAVNAGSVILYTADENGLVSNYIVLATYDSAKSVLNIDAEGIALASVTTADNTTYSYVYGFIDEYGDKIKLKDGSSYKVRGNMYTFEYKTKGSKVTVDDYTVGNVDMYENGKANFVFMKLADGKVTDIYAISNRANYTATITPTAVVEEVVEEVVVDEDIVEVEIED